MTELTPLDDAPPSGIKVHAYRNLHIPGRAWSIKEVGVSKIGWRVSEIALSNVEFRVQPAGRKKAIETGVRNVHAYIVGTVVSPASLPTTTKWELATYTPFDGVDGFTADSESALDRASWARLSSEGLTILQSPDIFRKDGSLVPHGTATAYRKWKCRCYLCTDAQTEAVRASRGPSSGRAVIATCGTRSGYTKGCRCKVCTAANAVYQRGYQYLRRKGISYTPDWESW